MKKEEIKKILENYNGRSYEELLDCTEKEMTRRELIYFNNYKKVDEEPNSGLALLVGALSLALKSVKNKAVSAKDAVVDAATSAKEEGKHCLTKTEEEIEDEEIKELFKDPQFKASFREAAKLFKKQDPA